MTAFELFKRAYFHYMGHSMRHLVDGHIDDPKSYVVQFFDEDLKDYYIDEADSTWILLSLDNPANPRQCPIEELHNIELKAGYYLCHHDGHNSDWMLWWYTDKAEAKASYKNLYMRYFRHQNWYWIVKIGQ